MGQKQKHIQEMFEKGVLINKELLDTQELPQTLIDTFVAEEDLLVLNHDYSKIIMTPHLVDWYEIDEYRVRAEKGGGDGFYHQHISLFRAPRHHTQHTHSSEQHLSPLEIEVENTPPPPPTTVPAIYHHSGDEQHILPEPLPFSPSSVTIVILHNNIPSKYKVHNFTSIFFSRYKFLENLLRQRQELSNALSIGRLNGKKEREPISLIGIVGETATSKNGNIIITLEDPTGSIKLITLKNNLSALTAAEDIVPDEVIGVCGFYTKDFFFVEKIIWPDIPIAHELKKLPPEHEEVYALFLSDIHVGSALFLREEFNRFLQWLKGNAGDISQREIAKKVRYIFIAGDAVDGVGVYPGQEEELAILDIREQYAELARFLAEIPCDKEIILGPGNHDVVHLAEPQPTLYKEYAPDLYTLPNLTLVTNPSVINIAKTDNFPGFDVLLYHGYSFDFYVANVNSIRNGGGYHRADLIMKYLLKRRHLAPSFQSTPYFPGHQEDPLLIKDIPDFFVTGHIHYSNVANYRGITMISCSCWQGKTTFQEKLGHQPEPARVPLVNLKTREVKVFRFG